MKILDKIKKHLLLIIIMCAPLLAIIANSAYIFLSSTIVRPTFANVACVDKGSSGKVVNYTYYQTVEAAFDAAYGNGINDTIYILPSLTENNCNTVYLFENKTVEKGDSLILPFRRQSPNGAFILSDWDGRQSGTADGEATALYEMDTGNDPFSGVIDQSFSDGNENNVKFFRRTNLVIKSGVKLTIQGNLYVGGVLGREMQGLMGGTCGAYSEITLQKGISVDDKTEIVFEDCNEIRIYGYIKDIINENPFTKITAYNSKLYMPFVIYDYKGGSETAGLGNATKDALEFSSLLGLAAGFITVENHKDPFAEGNPVYPISPFNLMNSPNITTELVLDFRDNQSNGNLVTGLMDLYTGHKNIIVDLKQAHNNQDLPLISANPSNGVKPVLQIGAKTRVTIKNTSEDPRYTHLLNENGTAYSTNKTHLFFENTNNDTTYLNRMALNVNIQLATAQLDTSSLLFPISHLIEATVSGGTYVIDTPTKFLPGSKLTVSKDTTLTFAKDSLFYSDKDYDSSEIVNDHLITGYNNNPLANAAYAKDLDSSILEVLGAVKFNSRFGGKITAMAEGAKISISNDSDMYSKEGRGTFSYAKTGTFSYTVYFDLSNPFFIFDKPRGKTSNGENENLSKGEYVSEGTEWNVTDKAIIKGTISFDGGGSTNLEGAQDNKKLAVNNITLTKGSEETTISSDSQYLSYDWSESDIEVSDPYSATPTVSFPNTTANYTFRCKLSYDDGIISTQGDCTTVEVQVTKKTSSGGSCLIEGTEILLGDGKTTKKVENIKQGDKVLTFNHEEGFFEPSIVLSNPHENEESTAYEVTNLVFDNGKNIEIAYNHSFFNLSKNKYVTIDALNACSFIGDSFYMYGENGAKLISAYTYTKETKVYAPFTLENINVISNGLISVPGVFGNFLANIYDFENSGTMKIDADKKALDISTYGLYAYTDFKHLCNKEMFEILHFENLKVGIGKGMYTMKDIEKFISLYKKYFEK